MPVVINKNIESGGSLFVWRVDETLKELEESYPELVRSDRCKSFNHDLRRTEWLVARAILTEVGLPISLAYSEHGKPFYKNGPKISLTHSRNYVAVITHPHSEVGIDVQEIVSKVERIKHKYCNAEELKWAKATKQLTLIWSCKEALFKIKEKDVFFKEDITVLAPDPEMDKVNVVYKDSEKYTGRITQLEDYLLVYIIE